MKPALRGMGLVLVTAVRMSPWQSLLCLFETLGKVLAALAPLFIGIFATGALERDLDRMVVAAVALVGSTAANAALQAVGVNARVRQMELVGHTFDARIAELTARIPTLDHVETARYLDKLQILRDNENVLGGALNTLINLANTLAYAISVLLVAGAADRRLLILIALGSARLLTTRWSTRWEKDAEEAGAAPGRLTRHLIDLSLSPAGAAETRVFGHQRELRRQIGVAVGNWRRPSVRSTDRKAVLAGGHSAVFFATATALLVWMTQDVIAGTVSLQSLVVAVGVLQSLQTVSSSFAGAVVSVTKVGRNCARFIWLRDYADAAAAHTGRRQAPDRLYDGIRIDGLSFRYSGARRDSLTDITLDLPAGAVVALVGENGAGKSTLVKLLAGLYRPTRGRVLVDGRDLAEFDLTAWRSRMSAAFQDHTRFEFTAQRSVGVGDLAVLDDSERVHRALEDGAAADVVTALPTGLSTQLGTTWPGGVELSGGQWQRIAIARGMMRQSPLLLVLDEPTAAIDAATEHSLFERYSAAGRHARRHGGVTLLVTHRFSTVATADLVVVLDQGRVVEVGSHSELVSHRGKYAELHELQARGYR
ncbi:ABC transporter ATP-binding protein [Kribbella speibonae]|uniref:ABC transporter ATP-binding protein n=1 Tax=Kribbella speibonae TaxID=1572660 RepID=A0ABY2A4E0_9ACTN|nr:ABC transporter ATP-binding protein [Kribbella speibonae]TCC23119.1 ABC transporter ATP-binding protein [Kribbella speibonae]